MPRGKLILICQSGGEFVTNDDGTLSYTGGEAHALDINSETMFDDLKLKLAEMCNLEYESLSMKYFIPGNKRTPISVSNDKDLKRMYEIHGNSITADLFVMGRQGFNHEAHYMHAIRGSGMQLDEVVDAPVLSQIPVRVAPATAATGSRRVSKSRGTSNAKARSRVTSQPAVTTPTVIPATVASGNRCALSSKPVGAANAEAGSPIGVILAVTSKSSTATARKNASAASMISNDLVSIPVDETAFDPTTVDMNASPADTVKKRRRTAAWKIGANGPSIVLDDDDDDDDEDEDDDSDSDDDDDDAADGDKEMRSALQKKNMKTRQGKSQKENTWNDNAIVDVDVEWQSEDEDWIDVANSKDISAERMIASWKKGITGVGQDFKSVVEFRDALQKYAIARRFGYRLKKNETNRASGRCAAEGCSWRIHASWVPSEQVFRIKKMNKSHTCGGESWKHATPNKNWLVNTIKDRLRERPRQKPKDIANSLFEDFGMELNYSQVWRGIEDAKEQLQGSRKEAYNHLPWFCDKMVEANPGSFAKLSVGDENKFKHLFVSYDASIYGFQNVCRPLLFLDSTSLRSKYHEILLTATALDGDDGFFPVSFAVVDIENDDNWRWFLEQLKEAISTSRSVTFVSDKDKGLMKSVLEIFENAHHGYSMYHLLESLRRNWKGPFHGDGKVSLPGSLLAAAHAVRLDGFRMHTEQIRRVSVKVYDWLMQIEPECWTNALFKGERYNHITVDVAELYANWIEEVRDLPIIRKLEALGCKMAQLMQTRQMNSNGWTTKLTPSKEKRVQEETLKAQFLKVLFSSDTLFEVHDDSIHVVDTVKWHCSCLEWKLTGIPCRHAIAVFKCKGSSVYDYCSTYYTVDSFRVTYSKSINPVLDDFKPSAEENDASELEQVLPPTTPRPPIQPDDRRYRKGEPTRVMSCSRCKGEGHNKATCKAPIEPGPRSSSSTHVELIEPVSGSSSSVQVELIEACPVSLTTAQVEPIEACPVSSSPAQFS